MEMEEDSVHSDDDDSEYTYVTDEEEEEPAKKRGWFGFLRREKHVADDDDYESEEEGSHNDDGSAASDHQEDTEHFTTADNRDAIDQHSTAASASSEDEESKIIDKYDPQKSLGSPKEEEESILMAQAIQRVQQRIQSHGGNIYNAETTAATNQPSFIPQGVHPPPSELLESKNNTENSSINGGSKIDVKLEDQFNGNEQGEEEEEEEHPQEEEEKHDEDDDDDDEEEGPTIEEQRSLLSLAAEHDRVDVIKELLSISPNEDMNTSLLCGFSSADNDNHTNSNNNNNNGGNKDATKTTNTPKNDSTKSQHPTNNVIFFVPPPLHAAVAHGSVNAASCLLRMGANPSIRPKVPTPYLSRNYHPSPTRSRSTTKSSHMEEDRNYKKYHEMSAWELAFGSIVVLEDGDDDIDEDEEIEEEEEVTEKRGWFGFGGGGGGGRHDKKDDEVEEVTIQQQHQDANGKQRIIRRRQPLNIAPNKLEGIRHAFTAEALRAIGADEVHRLQQLLDSGMDSKMEVAGKSLVSWAIEMEAEGCCELLRGDHDDDDVEIKTGSGEDVIVSPPDDSNGGSSPAVVSNSSNGDVHVAQPTKPTNDQSTTVTQQKPIATIHDERLTGLSPKDILMLIQENENLIPALTTCRDELAEETSACQNILRDVQASGGRGGLSSQTLLDLVHSLKERRRELEESVKNRRHAWEEREDELDFFWEEVLNDEWREHLVQSGILDDNNDVVSDTTSSSSMISTTTASGYANASLDDLTRRFCEVDNRVNTLRSSIANLADECARYQAEFERAGMSGALSLTKSLRDELKEMESQLSEAKSGEAMCRRKIELIQERLNNSTRDEPVQEHVQNNQYVDDAEEYGYEGDDSHPDGQEQEDVSNLAYDFADKELMEGTAYAEAFVHRGMERECFQDQYEEDDDRSASNEGAASYESDHDDRESLENESAIVDKAIEEHIGFVVVNDANEVANEADERNPSVKQEEANVVNNDDDDETIPSEMQEVEEAATDAPHLGNGQSHKFEINETENVCADHKGEEHTDLNDVINAPIRPTDSELDTLKPSDALKSGMSTALVVRQPTGRTGLSLQLWDLIRRIVGLGRTPSYRAQSESSTNIMIV